MQKVLFFVFFRSQIFRNLFGLLTPKKALIIFKNAISFLIYKVETSLIGKALGFGSSDYGFDSHVSKLILENRYFWIVSHLYLAVANKKVFYDLPAFRKIKSLLIPLKKIGIIRNFVFLSTGEVRIFIMYSRFYYMSRKFKFYLKKSNSIIFTHKTLKILSVNLFSSTLLLNTTKGFLFHKEALNKKIGGKLIFFIS